MTDTRTTALVLRDADGNYYAIPREILDSCRVPDERRGELEKAAGVGDVVGFDASAASSTWGALGSVSVLSGIVAFEPVDGRRSMFSPVDGRADMYLPVDSAR